MQNLFTGLESARVNGKSYRDIVADAGYESVRNYLYLEQRGQNCFIKPISYEKQKTKRSGCV